MSEQEPCVLIAESMIAPQVADRLRQYLRTAWRMVEAPPMLDDGAVPQAIGEAVAVVGHRVSAEALRRAQRLRLVHCTGAGIDGIAVEELPPGAVLCNVHEHEVPIAEYVMMGVLMMACRVQEHAADLRRGRWTGSGRVHGAFHDELYGKTVGLIGFGRIGREVAQRARAFGMRVLALRRVEAADPLLDGCFTHDRLHVFLGSCDVVVLCCPLTNQTRGMLGGPELAAMRPTAILVNPARAQIVDEQALFEALRQRRIKGAVLDVWYQYPAAAHEAPAYGSRLPFHKLDNVLPTPHLAAWTEPMFERRMRFIAANLDRFVRGEPLAQVVAQGPQPGGRSAGLKETS